MKNQQITFQKLTEAVKSVLKEEAEKSKDIIYDNVNLNGLADKEGFSEKDANPDELKLGIEIEMEHTDDPKIAKKIALDHLAEIENYYTLLTKMEADAKKNS